MSIANTIPIKRAPSAIDLRPYEGCAITKAADGTVNLAASAATSISGVIHVPGNQGEMTDYFLPSYGAIIRVKLSSDPGTVNEGQELGLDTDGKWKAVTAGTGMITAQESGTADALIEATFK